MAPSINNDEREESRDLYILEHLLHNKIFPFLPLKYLCRLKLLSKETKSGIEGAQFALDQSQSTSSVFALVTLFFENNNYTESLLFFPNPNNTIGVPDPEVPCLKSHWLVNSSNGLFLYYLLRTSIKLCVCNPATQDKTFVPNYIDLDSYDKVNKMGLAYDPSSPDRFAIVRPLVKDVLNGKGTEYQFVIFRSEIRQWVLSHKRMYSSEKICSSSNAVYAKGKIYWCLEYHLIWYDVEKDTTGWIKLPHKRTTMASRLEISTFSGLVTCCIMSKRGIDGWVMRDGVQWEKYSVTWDILLKKNTDKFGIFYTMKLHGVYQVDSFFDWEKIRLLAFDGRNAYVAVLKSSEHRKEEVVLQCDLISGKVIDTKVSSALRERMIRSRIVEYKNSMARVPC